MQSFTIRNYTGGPVKVETSNGPHHLLRCEVTNRDATDMYFHAYDAASAADVTPGTDVKATAHVSQSQTSFLKFGYGETYTNGIVIQVTDSENGTGSDPATAMLLRGDID